MGIQRRGGIGPATQIHTRLARPMFEIPVALAPFAMAAFVLGIVGAGASMVFSALGRMEPDAVPTIEPWQTGFLGRLQMDGRWSRSASAFRRSMDCVLYAPAGKAGETRKMPRAARFSHRVQAIGPWVLRGTTHLETQRHEVELQASNYLELPPQFGLPARQWTVMLDGEVIGTLLRREGAIVAHNVAGDTVGSWTTLSVPGRLRHPAPSEEDALKPWYTPLEILGMQAQLRLPFFDGRHHPYDVAGVPFIRGPVSSGDVAIEGWALAYVAIACQAALALRIASPRRGASPYRG